MANQYITEIPRGTHRGISKVSSNLIKTISIKYEEQKIIIK